MKTAIAAYRLLVEVARSHGGISKAELRFIERYRRGLGIRDDRLEETKTPLTDRMIEGSQKEREETVLAMARVAHADGRISHMERARITEVALKLGVGRVQVANILGDVEEEGAKRAHRVSPVVLSLGVLLVAVVVQFTLSRGSSAQDEKFREIAAEYDPSILLIRVSYDLVKGEDRLRFGGEGSGFFVSEDGLIVTNKHVVQPWKFESKRVKLLDEGYELDEETVHLSAWTAGSKMLKARDKLDYKHAYDNRHGTLRIVAMAPENMVSGTRDGHRGRYHALDNSDLALLRASLSEPAHPLPLVTDDAAEIQALEPVVVLGFPKGTKIQEGQRAVSSPSLGFVRHVQESIMIDASISEGSSGGPLVDRNGAVIGVSARRFGAGEGLGRCIQAKYVRELLETVEQE